MYLIHIIDPTAVSTVDRLWTSCEIVGRPSDEALSITVSNVQMGCVRISCIELDIKKGHEVAGIHIADAVERSLIRSFLALESHQFHIHSILPGES